jgi:hypothetical protein
MTVLQEPAVTANDKPIPSSEGTLHKDYGHKCSFEEKILVVSLKGRGAKVN